MRVAVITEQPLNNQHGTGAQILRVLKGQDLSFFHFYTYDMFGQSEIAESYLLADPLMKSYRGRRTTIRLKTALGLTWWKNDKVHPGRINRLISENQLKADVAYMVIGCEETARRALSLLDYLPCPYIVHIMDLYHERLTPEEMPGLSKLVQGAGKLFVITEPMQDQFRTLGGPEPEIMRVGQAMFSTLATPPTNEELRVVMIGRPYPEGAAVLAEAWPQIVTRFPKIRLDYAGAHFNALPDSLKQIVKDNGSITNPAALHDFLSNHHVAFLCGPNKLDEIGLYSLPSRTTDYFAAGLPTLACVPRGTATRRVFEPLNPTGVKFVEQASEFVPALNSLLQTWTPGSALVRNFAEQNFDIVEIRSRLLRELETASATTNTRPTH